jgi:hypothetical protein
VIRLSGSASVRGRVRDSSGQPVQDTVKIRGPLARGGSSGPYDAEQSIDTDSEGHFGMAGLEPGRYLLSAASGKDELEVILEPDEARAGLELVGGTETITCLVRDDTGRPLANVWVSSDDDRVPASLSDAAGKVTLRAPSNETLRLRMEHGHLRAYTQAGRYGGECILEAQRLTGLHGRVTRQGQPVTRYQLIVIGPRDQRHEQEIDDPQGRYEDRHLLAGYTSVVVRTPAGEVASGLVILHPGESVFLNLEVQPLARLRGRCLDARDRRPLVGVSIQAFNPRVYEHDPRLIQKTDQNGAFAFERLIPGDIRLQSDVNCLLSVHLAGGADLDAGDLVGLERVSWESRGELGLWASVTEDRLLVYGVDPGGPAEGAGVHRGDEIVLVDGYGPPALPLRLLRALLVQIATGQRVRLRLRAPTGGTHDVDVIAGPPRQRYGH